MPEHVLGKRFHVAEQCTLCLSSPGGIEVYQFSQLLGMLHFIHPQPPLQDSSAQSPFLLVPIIDLPQTRHLLLHPYWDPFRVLCCGT